jgi:hypothetical protein
METLRCPVFVDGKECGRELTEVNLDAKLIVSDLVVCECSLGHRTFFLRERRPQNT